MGKKDVVSAEKLAQEVTPDHEKIFLEDRVRELEGRLETFQKEHGSLRGSIRSVAEAVDRLEPPKIIYRAPSKSKVSTPVACVPHITDWHMGATIDRNEVEGFNEFSPAILKSRIRNWAQDLLEWVELHRSNYDVPKCLIPVTADMVSGGLHDELLVTDAYPSPVQAVESGHLLAEFVSTLSPHFETVEVHYIGVDNHGRLTKKLQHNQGGYNTWNYVVSSIAELELQNHSNVQWNYYPREIQSVHFHGRDYLLTHGHNVKGWAGFPYYGIERQVGKEAVRRLQTGIGKFDRVILGHWHAPLQHPNFWIGGSAQGTSAYDHANGRHSPPIQSAWFIHPRHAEFDRTDWLLRSDDERKA